MKKMMIISSALLLSACGTNWAAPEPAVLEEENDREYQTICLDGIQYWHKHKVGGYEGLTVRIDPETLKPKRC